MKQEGSPPPSSERTQKAFIIRKVRDPLKKSHMSRDFSQTMKSEKKWEDFEEEKSFIKYRPPSSVSTSSSTFHSQSSVSLSRTGSSFI